MHFRVSRPDEPETDAQAPETRDAEKRTQQSRSYRMSTQLGPETWLLDGHRSSTRFQRFVAHVYQTHKTGQYDHSAEHPQTHKFTSELNNEGAHVAHSARPDHTCPASACGSRRLELPRFNGHL